MQGMDFEQTKINYQELLWDFLGIAWRRKYWVLIPSLLGVLASVILMVTLPKVYQSNTLILVEAQKVPQSVVQSAVTGSAQSRLSTIKQQVLSRSYLTKIIDKFSLYQAEDPEKEMSLQKKIIRMRENIALSTNGRRRLESFSISFSGKDPETVMNVTNELASLVLEENLKIREQFVEGAIDFLDSELNSKQALLERREKELSEYKIRHIGELPGQLNANLRALDRLQSHLDTIQLAKNAAKDRIVELGKALKSTKASLAAAARGEEGGEVPLSPSTLEVQLKRKRETLSSLLLEYNESYPDVVMLRSEIKGLEAQQSLLNTSKKAAQGSAQTSTVQGEGLAGGFEQAGPVIAIKKQIRATQRELKDLEKSESETRAQIRLYEQRVENTPRREQDLIILQRDYDSIASSYQALLSKRLNAQISRNLERRQKGEQFRVIDPANLPGEPVKPDKFRLLLMGIALGLGSGVGLAFVKEQLDNTVRKPSEVERITTSRILAEIPDFEADLRVREKEKKTKVVDIERFSGRTMRVRRIGRKK